MSEPYSGEPEPSGSERMRWVQGALNDVLRLRLPVDGHHGCGDAERRSQLPAA